MYSDIYEKIFEEVPLFKKNKLSLELKQNLTKYIQEFTYGIDEVITLKVVIHNLQNIKIQ